METRSRCRGVDQNTTMNKAAHKLKGLPHIYCINLDGEPHRWEAAENMLRNGKLKIILVSLHMMVVKMI